MGGVVLALILWAAGGQVAKAADAPAKPASQAKAKLPPPKPRHDAPDIPFRRAPMAAATRSVHIPVTTNLHVAFDTELLRAHAVWTGGTLNLWGTVYHGAKDRFYCDYDGRTLWGNPALMPWRTPSGPETTLPADTGTTSSPTTMVPFPAMT